MATNDSSASPDTARVTAFTAKAAIRSVASVLGLGDDASVAEIKKRLDAVAGVASGSSAMSTLPAVVRRRRAARASSRTAELARKAEVDAQAEKIAEKALTDIKRKSFLERAVASQGFKVLPKDPAPAAGA